MSDQQTDRKTWLEGLRVGDRVIISDHAGNFVTTVQRLTKTLIITVQGKCKYRRSSGQCVGYSYGSLAEPTQANMDRIARLNLARHLRKYDWKRLSLETLRTIRTIINEAGK